MIIVHHLDDVRSQRIVWLLEELGQPYEVAQHKRDPQTRLAPLALKQAHPLARYRGRRAEYPNLDAWVGRFQARPAYRGALARGGAYSFIL